MATDPTVLTVFVLVYAGMLFGRLPGLTLDRAGIALCGAIALVALDRVPLERAWALVDVPTIALLFGLMIVSAELRLAGAYARLTRELGALSGGAPRLLWMTMAGTALLAALLANDIVCLAATPVLVEVCAARRLAPAPFLIGHACAANIGSAATLIGNPQNMLIGATLDLSFRGYAALALVPALGGLVLAWALIAIAWRTRWSADVRAVPLPAPPFDRWRAAKSACVLAVAVAFFLDGRVPREIVALGAGGLLLVSRRASTRGTLALVDWHLLLLFIGLFVVNGALAESGATRAALELLRARGVALETPPALFVAVAVLSNLVSNVPAVMLLLPAATAPGAGESLALASTLAGNLVLVGSIANLIVVEEARRAGVSLGFREHAALGVPITLATLALAAGWLALTSW